MIRLKCTARYPGLQQVLIEDCRYLARLKAIAGFLGCCHRIDKVKARSLVRQDFSESVNRRRAGRPALSLLKH